MSISNLAKRTLLASLLSLTCLSLGLRAEARDHKSKDALGAKVVDAARRNTQKPRVEMVFALDTTGSMGGLLQGAKQKIWAIINEVAKGKPTPEIRVGLVAYRDRGDEYVTRVTQLSGDLDAVYKDLMAFSAGGGGDGPEDVNRALADAVNRIEWSGQDMRAFRVIFLVGDAPPHMDYQDEPSFTKTVATARRRGIVVNTIRCGTWDETQTHFARIASLGKGEFLSISQTGGMLATATPYDKKLADLSGSLDDTYVMRGKAKERESARASLGSASRTADTGGGFAVAERATFRARAEPAAAAPAKAAKADLVSLFERDGASADKALSEEAELPAELAAMDLDTRRDFVRKKSEARRQLQDEMKVVAGKREAWLKENSKGSKDSFDVGVAGLVKAQAAEAASIEYKD